MTENRKVLNTSDLDGFDKRKLPSPGFQVEVVLADYNGSVSPTPSQPAPINETDRASMTISAPAEETNASLPPNTITETRNKDDVFSDSEAEEGGSMKSKRSRATNIPSATPAIVSEESETQPTSKSGLPNITHGIERVSLRVDEASMPTAPAVQEPRAEENKSSPFQAPELESTSTSEFKAIAADASVFTFGDEDYESE